MASDKPGAPPNMQETKLKPRLKQRDELDDPTLSFSDLLAFKSHHQRCDYTVRNGPHKNLFTEVYQLWNLDPVRRRFLKELKRSCVATFDLEGDLGIVDGIILQPLGGTCVYINVYEILRGISKKRLVHELRFLFDVISSPKFIKLGSGIRGDLEELSDFFREPRFAGSGHVFDTREMFEWNRDNGMYDPVLVSQEAIGNRAGIPVLALLHNGFNHKCYDVKRFVRHNMGTIKDFDKFPAPRKIGPRGCDMYQWKKWNLEWYQQIYCYLDTTTVLRFFIDSVYFVLQGPFLNIDPDVDERFELKTPSL